jgi:DNA-binding MarR family transcriptional regulator
MGGVSSEKTNPERPARPDRLATDQLAVWRALLDTVADLRRRLGATLQESDVTPADYEVLLALSEANHHEMRSSDLAAAMNWERSRLSHQLGRMEKRNLIRRSDSASDNRAAMVSLTSDGESAFRRAAAPHLKAVKALFADALTAEQFDSLAGMLGAIRRHLDDET